VELGAFATFQSEYVELGAHAVKAKALDDRLGCALLCTLLQTLYENHIRPSFSICCAFTVREELGRGSGAAVAAHRVDPALAVVLETTAVADLPEAPLHRQVARLGEGGVLSNLDNGTIYDREFLRFVLSLAAAHGISVQEKRYRSGGNDASHVHRARAGVKTLALSAPCRYLHSAACVMDLRDADAMASLIFALSQSDALSTLL
jgi:endoglucanase